MWLVDRALTQRIWGPRFDPTHKKRHFTSKTAKIKWDQFKIKWIWVKTRKNKEQRSQIGNKQQVTALNRTGE